MNKTIWTLLGMAVVGILLGIGPFQRGHKLLESDRRDYTVLESYASDGIDEDCSHGEISFRGKRCSGSVGCDCSGFLPITNGDEWQKNYCKKCGHRRSCHH